MDVYQVEYRCEAENDKHGTNAPSVAVSRRNERESDTTPLYFELLQEQLFASSTLTHAVFDLLWLSVVVGRVRLVELQENYTPVNSQNLVHDLEVDLSPAHGVDENPEGYPALCRNMGYSTFLQRDCLVADRIAASPMAEAGASASPYRTRYGGNIDFSRLCEDDLRLVVMQVLGWCEAHILSGAHS